MDVRSARSAVIPCEAIPTSGIERLYEREDVVAVGVAAEPMVDDEQFVGANA